ncbi:WYL domain-containing protein [Corynebacterium variabile]|uniref:WYL domain-containing protein n=1 Tax=Corynebacterium variabile TaxID=1727 RepID=UPI002647E305|nr:WYL domain-containing protein [Corynebacterium variabile]MDN6476848.1 WYL domain-containing protein [Corynebacterium variabile]MDN6677677.1 WYL domain-containing protein [Corynebacterium variabile]
MTTRTAPRKGSRKNTLVQLRRVLSVLAWLRAHPDASLMTTADRFGVSVPQLTEELTRVQESGLPGLLPGSLVDLTVTGPRVTLNDTFGLDRPLALTEAEADSLELNLEKLASILADEEQADADTAATRLRSLVTSGEDSSDVAPVQPANPGATVLASLRRAVASRQWVRFRYLSVSSDSLTTRELIPDQASVLDGVGYLWGRTDADQTAADQRCFAVTRMDTVEILDRPAPAALPREIDAEDPFGFRTAEQWAELELTEEAMWMLEYLPVWHIDGTRVEIPDTGAWLERFILAYAPEITAVVPDTLAGRVGQRSSAALAAYRRLA